MRMYFDSSLTCGRENQKGDKEYEGGARYLFNGIFLDVSMLLKCHAKPRRCEEMRREIGFVSSWGNSRLRRPQRKGIRKGFLSGFVSSRDIY